MTLEETNDTIARALGEDLRRLRQARGWTRRDLTAQLPSKIGESTLLTYENGTRHCSFVRLVEICQALDVATADVVQCALQRAGIDLDALRVDLRAVIRDGHPDFRPVRRWARNRLDGDPNGTGIVQLVPDSIREMAAAIDYPQMALVSYLATFVPAPQQSTGTSP